MVLVQLFRLLILVMLACVNLRQTGVMFLGSGIFENTGGGDNKERK